MSAPTTHFSSDTTKRRSSHPETHQRAMSTNSMQHTFAELLHEALTKPGTMNAAYRAFHNYSIGNQMLAALQLIARGLTLSPIASFNGWKEQGRFVKKGEKAISLYMPVSVKQKKKNDGDEDQGDATATFSVYMLRPNWFSLEQTEGNDFTPELRTPEWDAETAMAELDVAEERFEMVRGNLLGYAIERRIAISPLNPLKHKTRFHELAHVLLGHTSETEMTDESDLSSDICEVEAEGVAYILCTLLDLPGQAESRHYMQSWLGTRELPETSARRMFGVADKIMKAGRPVTH